MECNRQETSLNKMLKEKCGKIDSTEHENPNSLPFSNIMLAKFSESTEVINTHNLHSLESLAINAIFNFISGHGVDDTDLFFHSLPLPQSFIVRIKEQFDHYTYMYFVNFIEPTIQYQYPNEY